MVNKLFGKKLGMTRYFLEEGKSVPVTVLRVGPCVVTQKKSLEREGYNAIQVGFDPQKENRVNKPLKGHLKASGGQFFRHLCEIRVDDSAAFELGQEIKSDMFSIGDLVHI
jgi:large subunit ribosomal protein L3